MTASTLLIGKLQRDFASALLDPAASLPEPVSAASEAQRHKRFAVYRNNVHASLATALAARFPVVERLVGDEFFGAMAQVFVRLHPPRSPVLSEYGADFADFIDGFEPAADVPYLADVARLEWQRNRAYNAADRDHVSIAALATLPPDQIEAARLELHPAAGWITSPFPVVAIWQTNTHDETVKSIHAEASGETALVTRPALDVLVTKLSEGVAPFLDALAGGLPLGTATETALALTPELDLASLLAVLFTSGAIARVEPCA